ncbi:penicillin-binding protein 2 [Candidatus Babeliales bacterium]|nr:penicillin-binding protein 2 [Candidatus Babeliales bacterium]
MKDRLFAQRHVRIKILMYTVFLLYGVIFFRLFQLQVDQKYFLAEKAQKQHHDVEVIRPVRGIFHDRNKKPLVFNQKSWDIALIPAQKKIDEKSKKQLFEKYPEIAKKLSAEKWGSFCWLERQASSDKKELIEHVIPAVVSFVSSKRYYPYEHSAHLLGFTNIDGKGLAGLELLYSTTLAGKTGKKVSMRQGKKSKKTFNETVVKPCLSGESILLTIDERLQSVAYQVLSEKVDEVQAEYGSVMIVDPTSGEVLSMVSYPSFDQHQVKKEDLEKSINRATNVSWEVGSVIKGLLALAALDEELVTPDSLIDCSCTTTKLGGITVKHTRNMGKIPFGEVIQKSNNIGVAKVGLQLHGRLYDHYKKLGLGAKTALSFPGQDAGYLRSPDHWSRPTPVVLSFGYEVSVTVAQLAQAFSIIANNGVKVPITLLMSDSSGKNEQLYRDSIVQDTKDILERVGRRFGLPGYRVMGKTGTARLIKDGAYSSQHHIYTFGGIVEKGDYKRVIITMVKEPEKKGLLAAQITAPLFRVIAERMVAIEQANLF